MDRQLMAYILLALLIVGLAAALARARYNSRAAVQKRRRVAEQARWAEQARARAELEPATDPRPPLP
jgi:hypothetical protein